MDLANISDYCKRHCLRINPPKSSALIFTPRRMYTDIKERISLNLNDAVIPIVDYSKNLGVIIDSNLKFDRHCTNTAKAAYNNNCLRLLYSSRHIVNFKTRKKLVENLVLPKFSYSMVLYYAYLDCLMKYRMQKLQNKIRNLGWLPLNLQYKYLLSTLVHSILATNKPAYRVNRLIPRRDIIFRNLRHSHLLAIPSHNTSLFQKYFTYNAVKHYNNINQDHKSRNILLFKKYIRSELSKTS
nr:unnamed protein product [Callosobruchus chinensis]